MEFITYKKILPFRRQYGILKDDLNLDLYDETKKECILLIEKYRHMVEEDCDSYTALETIKEFLSQNFQLVNPNIYITTGFLNQVIYYFISPSLGTKNLFISILELLTNFEMICDFIINDDRYDFMTVCAQLISDEINIDISEQYINIMIHLLPSFFKFEHEDSELFIESISSSSAHLSVIKFMCHLISLLSSSESLTISAPEVYIEILYDKFQKLTDNNLIIDEDIFKYLFHCFSQMSNKDITNNAFILDTTEFSNKPIFELVMKRFDADEYIDSQKVMDPLFKYIISVFDNKSIEKANYEKILFHITKDFNFYIYVIQNSQNASIRKSALNCLYTATNLDSLQDEKEIIEFLNDMSLFEFLDDIFKNGSAYEKSITFNIIMKKIAYIQPTQENIEYIYDLDFLDEVKDFISIDIEKSTCFYAYILYYMSKTSRGEEVASRIYELNILEEIDNYLDAESITDRDKENISRFKENISTLLKMLLDSTLGEEE